MAIDSPDGKSTTDANDISARDHRHEVDRRDGHDSLEPAGRRRCAVEVELDHDEHRRHDRAWETCLVQSARSAPTDVQPQGRRIRRAEVDGVAPQSVAAAGERPDVSVVSRMDGVTDVTIAEVFHGLMLPLIAKSLPDFGRCSSAPSWTASGGHGPALTVPPGHRYCRRQRLRSLARSSSARSDDTSATSAR